MKYLIIILLFISVSLYARKIETRNHTYYKAKFVKIVPKKHIIIEHAKGTTRVKWKNLKEKYRLLFLLRDFFTVNGEEYITVQVRQITPMGIWVWDAFKRKKIVWILWEDLPPVTRNEYGY